MKELSQASKTAIGGMAVALSVVLMLPTAFEIFVYALPAIAGMLTLFCVIELGKSWAAGVYAAVELCRRRAGGKAFIVHFYRHVVADAKAPHDCGFGNHVARRYAENCGAFVRHSLAADGTQSHLRLALRERRGVTRAAGKGVKNA